MNLRSLATVLALSHFTWATATKAGRHALAGMMKMTEDRVCDLKNHIQNRVSIEAMFNGKDSLNFSGNDKLFDKDCIANLQYLARRLGKQVNIRVNINDPEVLRRILLTPYGKEFSVLLIHGMRLGGLNMPFSSNPYNHALLGLDMYSTHQDEMFRNFLDSIGGDMSRVTLLGFNGHQVSEKTVDIISDGLGYVRKLTKLAMGVPVGSDLFLLRALRNSPGFIYLETLDLSHSMLGDNGVRVLADIIKNTPKLKNLYLRHAGLTDDHLEVLMPAVAQSTSLESINVDGNWFEDKGERLIVQAVKNLPSHIKEVRASGKWYRNRQHSPLSGIEMLRSLRISDASRQRF